jgi:hypothetical protein
VISLAGLSIPNTWNYNKLVLFADDTRTSVIVSNSNLVNFKNDLIFSFEQSNAWFNTNLLSLNYSKTQYVQFRTTNSLRTRVDISYISYKNKYVNDTNTQFLGITVGISLSWKNNIDGLIVKLSKVCYAVTSL